MYLFYKLIYLCHKILNYRLIIKRQMAIINKEIRFFVLYFNIQT